MKVPDPLLGPKPVRWLLALRGFVGYVRSQIFSDYLLTTLLQLLRPLRCILFTTIPFSLRRDRPYILGADVHDSHWSADLEGRFPLETGRCRP